MKSDQVKREEQALVERAQRGDRDAFGELVWRYQDTVYTLAMRLVGPNLAADVAQEALIRAWRAMPKFRGDASFSTWLHRITVNTAWTQRKRAAKHVASELEDTLVDTGQSPEHAGETADLRRRLVGAIEKLSPSQRSVVVLRDISGWSHAEIARELEITTTTAKVRLHRARKRLQILLEEDAP